MFIPNGKESFHDLQFDDFLVDKIFVGLVEDNKDPRRKGRIRVRVQGVFNDIPTEHIPWASPFRSLDGTSFCVPAIGKIVSVTFSHGNLYEPQYNYSENYNINLQNKLLDLGDDKYANFVALLFDHRSQICVDDESMNLDFFDNVIRLKKDSIDIKLKDNSQKLNLGHSACDQNAILGTNFFEWMDSFMNLLLKPSTLMGNNGSPILKPELDAKIQEYKTLRPNFISNNVMIVNNDKIKQDSYDNKRKSSPVKDDFVKINGEKILEPSKTPKSKNDDIIKENLKVKITEQRKNALIEQVDNTPIVTKSGVGFDSGDGTFVVAVNTSVMASNSTISSESNIDGSPKGNDNKSFGLLANGPNEEENEEKEKMVEDQMSEDPYSESWTNNARKTTVEVENTSPGYGSYTVPVDDTDMVIDDYEEWSRKGKSSNIDYESMSPGYGANASIFKSQAGNAAIFSETPWIDIARGQIGTQETFERTGKSNTKIIDYFSSISAKNKEDNNAWGSAFVNWVIEKSGMVGTKSPDALSWKTWKGGNIIKEFKEGCIVVLNLKNDTKYHVCFMTFNDGKTFKILGGDQGLSSESSVNEENWGDVNKYDFTYIYPKEITPNFTATGGKLWEEVFIHVVTNIEGGYWNPNAPFNHSRKGMGISTETIYGIDRYNGSWEKMAAGREFWSYIDKVKNGWSKRYAGGALYNCLKKEDPNQKKIMTLASNMMKVAFDKMARSYLTNNKALNIIMSNKKLLFHFQYACWNGCGYFKRFASRINKSVESGITNPNKLVEIAKQHRQEIQAIKRFYPVFEKAINKLN